MSSALTHFTCFPNQARYINARNLRLTFISDLLSSVRLIKMYAWEKAYADKVQQIRDLEIAHFFRLNILDGMLDSIFSASSPVVRPLTEMP